MKVYNGEGQVLGRLGARVAKDILLGEEVRIVNSEKVVISGNKVLTLAKEKQRLLWKGHPMRSQKHSRLPYLLVKRAIRGMLPWKTPRGKEAYHRLLCYNGLPAEFAHQSLIALEKNSFKKLPSLKYTTVGEVCKLLGGK